MEQNLTRTGTGVGSLAAARLLQQSGHRIEVPEDTAPVTHHVFFKGMLLGSTQISGDVAQDSKTLEALEPGARIKLIKYHANSKKSIHKEVNKHFSSAEVRKLLQFPFLFLGVDPRTVTRSTELEYSHPNALYIQLNVQKSYKNLGAHTVVLSKDWLRNVKEVFNSTRWPGDPSFYITAPAEQEIFIHIPVSTSSNYTEDDLRRYSEWVIGIAQQTLHLDGLKEHITATRITGPNGSIAY